MANSVRDIQKSENPNAICAICAKNSRKLVAAAAIRQWDQFNNWFVCEGHADRARRWDEICAASERYRATKAGR